MAAKADESQLFWLRGSVRTLAGSNSRLVAWRERCKIYCGDWELTVAAAPRKCHATWEDFARAAKAPLEFDEFECSSCPGSNPAEVLFRCTNFGTLYWSWATRSGLQTVYAKSSSGEEFLPRIWVELDPGDDVADVEEARQEAQAELAKMPDAIQGGMLKETMAASIDEDMALLTDLVREAGSFGAASLPDGLSPIVTNVHAYNDGNDRVAAFGTSAYWYYVEMSTS